MLSNARKAEYAQNAGWAFVRVARLLLGAVDVGESPAGTLVRDVGNDMTRILAECDPIARDRSPGPWIWCSGSVLDGSPPSTTAAVSHPAMRGMGRCSFRSGHVRREAG